MKHLRLLLAASVLMVLIPGTSHAGSTEVTYVASPGLRISDPSVPVGVGGFQFTTPARPKTVKVLDTNGNGVSVNVCQENGSDPTNPNDQPNICGDGGDDVSANHCTEGKAVDISTFKANSPFTVFVRTADASLSCEQVGTVGTITVTW